MDFCKEFNGSSHIGFFKFHFLIFALISARTSHLVPGTPTPVNITIQSDRTFTFVVKAPTASYLIKRAIGLEKGSGEAGKVVSGSINLKQIYEIAKLKGAEEGMAHVPLEGVVKSLIGTCKSMGLTVTA